MESHQGSLAQRNPLGVACIVLFSVFFVLDGIALAIRLRSRHLQGSSLCLNDFAVLLAWPITAGLLVCGTLIVQLGGVGQHIQYVSPKEITLAMKLVLPPTIIWATSNSFIKISILHFYNTIFGHNKPFRYATYATAAVIICFNIGVILQVFLICRPFAKEWDPKLPGSCGSNIKNVLAEAIINMIIDVAIVILPMPLIWRLQMAKWRKSALMMIFGLGLTVCVITVTRIVFVAQATGGDFTYTYAKIAILTGLEPLLGIIIACLPMFPPTLRNLLRSKENQDSEIAHSGSTRRLHTKSLKSSSMFCKLDDSYPLTEMEGRTENEITGPDSKASSMATDHHMTSRDKMDPQYMIHVEKGWEIRSDEVV